MDTTGAIAPGTVEQLVLWAKDDRFRGSIDVRGEHAASLYFSAGFIAHIDGGEGGPAPSGSDTKERVHARLAQRLAALLAFADGSYVIQRSDQLPPDARWLFGPQGLIDTAKAAIDPSEPSRWHETVVQLDDRRVDGVVQMGEDAFRVVVALARSMRGRAVQTELGWPTDRVDRALDELTRRNLLAPLAPHPDDVEGPAPTTTPRAEPPVVDLRPEDRRRAATERRATRATNDLPSRPPAPAAVPDAPTDARPMRAAPSSAPRPVATTDDDGGRTTGAGGRTRASALRRLIQNLR